LVQEVISRREVREIIGREKKSFSLASAAMDEPINAKWGVYFRGGECHRFNSLIGDLRPQL
jgi:hypothetical protein